MILTFKNKAMPPTKEPPIVWYLNNLNLPKDETRANKLKECADAVAEFNKGDKTLDWLDERFHQILGDLYP